MEQFWKDFCNFFANLWNSFVEFWIGTPSTETVPGKEGYLGRFLSAIICLIIGIIIVKIILKIIAKILKVDKKIIKEKSIKSFILSTIKVSLYFLLIIVFLSLLRVDLTSAATIFSSGLLAIGLALQDIISNFASGVIILSSKPFLTGDYVNIGNGECEGTIINVKFLVTVIETVDKQIVSIPNKTITSSVIMNYSRNPLRRLKIDFAVDYSTDIQKAKEILLELAEKDNRILKDPKPNVYITGLDKNEVNVSLRCFVPNIMYWDLLFELNEKTVMAYKEAGIGVPINRVQLDKLEVKKNEII